MEDLLPNKRLVLDVHPEGAYFGVLFLGAGYIPALPTSGGSQRTVVRRISCRFRSSRNVDHGAQNDIIGTTCYDY